MIETAATNIVSPLGFTTEDNFLAVREGRTGLETIEGWNGTSETVTAALFSGQQRRELGVEGFTFFESLAIRSVEDALRRTDIDVSSPRLIFILSTTKANVNELSSDRYVPPGEAAGRIARHFGFRCSPVVVCNACISGVSAQILASRLIASGAYDTAIVCGADCQGSFTISGFLSFKALSPEPCRPFDIERRGLNLGEAAATIIFRKAENVDRWHLCKGSLTNDAYHISAPSPAGDGVYRAIRSVLDGNPDVISVHGTATMFNDQMESKAIVKAGLSDVPVSALKGFFGHTLGAAGILEAILTMRALDEGIVLPVKGFEEIGVSGRISLDDAERKVDGRSVLKMISGFGGCNAAALYSKNVRSGNVTTARYKVSHSVHITQDGMSVDGETIPTTAKGPALLTEIYRNHIGGCPKFYKMDLLSRLVFAATEMLEQKDESDNDGKAVVIFNRSSSILADREHLGTVSDPEDFYPSPSVFVYTLPNISTGEVAIRHGIKGETSLYILESRDEKLMSQILDASFLCPQTKTVITGWADCGAEDDFEADLKTTTRI